MLKNKKANYSDIAWYIQFALAFVICAGIMLLFVSNFNNRVQTMNNETIPQDVKDAHADYTTFLPTAVDYLFIMLFLVFFVFSIVQARLIPSSPLFIVVSMFVLILLPFIALIVENVWDGWYQQPVLGSIYNLMTFLPFVMNNFVYFILLYSVGVAIALLTKENG